MSLAEDFMLLAMRADDGRPLIGHLHLECGLAAAVLLDLAGAGRVEVARDRVVVADPTALGVPEQDAALARLSTQAPHNLQWWIRSLRTGLYDRILARLVDRGAVTERRGRVLGIIPTVRHPPADLTTPRDLRARLAALLDGGPADARIAALLVVVHATGLDRVILPAAEPSAVERRLADLGGADVAGAVANVIQDVQAAVAAAVVAATTATA